MLTPATTTNRFSVTLHTKLRPATARLSEKERLFSFIPSKNEIEGPKLRTKANEYV